MDEDEADAEGGHDQTGLSPAPRREVERGERGQTRQSDALQHQAETLPPDLADHPEEGQTQTNGEGASAGDANPSRQPTVEDEKDGDDEGSGDKMDTA